MAKKVLVVYYSKTGNTERVAKDIASRLGADIEKIIDKKNRAGILGYIFGGRDGMKERTTEIGPITKNPAEYDIVVIGTPVWGWNMTPAVRTYIEQNRDRLKSVAFFATAGNFDMAKMTVFMEKLAGKKAVASTGFNRGDLKDEKVYGGKLTAFVETLRLQ
jgi:flavodoxin